MEEFQTMMEDQEEFEGESILEDFEDFVMGYNFVMIKWGVSFCC